MHDHVPGLLACLVTPALHSQLVSRGTPHSSGTGFRMRHRFSVFRMAATILHVLHRRTFSCSCTRAQPLLEPHQQRPALPPRCPIARVHLPCLRLRSGTMLLHRSQFYLHHLFSPPTSAKQHPQQHVKMYAHASSRTEVWHRAEVRACVRVGWVPPRDRS